VVVSDDLATSARTRPSRTYLPPQVAVGVIPSLSSSNDGASGVGFRQIDALRGAFTTLAVRLLVLHEGVMRIDGVARGLGQSRLVAWRLDGTISDAPGGSGTVPGTLQAASESMRLQWNSPDRIVSTHAQDYLVPVTLYVETRFPDGHIGSYAIRSSFSVSVNFAAQSG
jgi:hypothetical protein